MVRKKLAELTLAQGQTKAAYAQLKQLHKTRPADFGTLCQLAELAFETGNMDDLRNWEGRLAALEGLDGSETYIINGILRARPGMPVTPQTAEQSR